MGRISMYDNSGKMRYVTFWELSGLGMKGPTKKLMDKGWKAYTLSDFTHYELKIIEKFIHNNKGKVKLLDPDFFSNFSEYFEIDYTCSEYSVCFIDYETAHAFAGVLSTLPERETTLISFSHKYLNDFRRQMSGETDIGWFECNEYDDSNHFMLISSSSRKKLMECKLRWHHA